MKRSGKRRGRTGRGAGFRDARQRVASSGSNNTTIQIAGCCNEIHVGAGDVPPTPLLHQLRPPPSDFTGRTAELNVLRRVLAAAGPGQAILGIFGAGGTGKTALAERLGAEVAEAYPDAQIYLDLKGVSDSLGAREAMEWVIRSMAPSAKILDNEGELAALYRETLHGKRVLLFMDNAAAADELQCLAPGNGSLLLITSQSASMLPGLVPIRIGALQEGEARELLVRICPQIGEPAEQLATLCGCLPLALRVVASTLAVRPDLPPAGYAKDLASGRERLDPVDASFEASSRRLPEDLRQLWLLLAVFPRKFSADAAAFVWRLDKRAAAEAMGRLVVTSLIECSEPSRYRLHDLARRFGDANLKESDREEAARRHALYSLRVLEFASILYWQGRKGSDLVALAMFDYEWDNIQAGQQWSASHAEEDGLADGAAAHLCSRYSAVSAQFLVTRVRVQESIRWHQTALAAARLRGDSKAETCHLGQLGTDYLHVPDSAEAIRYYKQQLHLARGRGDQDNECSALGNLGATYLDLLGDFEEAGVFFKQALLLACELGQRRTEGIILHNLGILCEKHERFPEALEYLERDLAIAREGGHTAHIAHSILSMGRVRKEMGDMADAAGHFEEARLLAQASGDRRTESKALSGLGIVVRRCSSVAAWLRRGGGDGTVCR